MNPPHTDRAAPPRTDTRQPAETDPAPQHFILEQDRLRHVLEINGSQLHSELALHDVAAGVADADHATLLGTWWKTLLHGAQPAPQDGATDPHDQPLRVVDLFSGVGGFVLGVKLLAAQAGKRLVCELAVDTDEAALAVHARKPRNPKTLCRIRGIPGGLSHPR